MQIAKGVLYRNIDDIIHALYKPQQAKHLERQFNENTFNILHLIEVGAIDKRLTWFFNTSDLGFFTGNYHLLAVPKDIITEFIYRVYLDEMAHEVMLDTKQELIDGLKEGIVDFFESKAYMYSMGAEQITEQPSYIWIWKTDDKNKKSQFLGVYTGIPIELLGGPLRKEIIYDCSECGVFEKTYNDIPDFYYDKDNNLYCPRCAKILKDRELKHIGE
jgi:hypothetical protein